MRLCLNLQYSPSRSEPRTVFFASTQARGEPSAGFLWKRILGRRVNEKGRRVFFTRLPRNIQRRQEAEAPQVVRYCGRRATRALGRAQQNRISLLLPPGLGSPQLRTNPLGGLLSVLLAPPSSLPLPFPCRSISLPSRPISLRVPVFHSSPVRIL